MVETRFDLAAKASEALGQYVNVDPVQQDPIPIVETVISVANKLLTIEHSFNKISSKKPSVRKEIKSAIQEWENKYKNFLECGEELCASFEKIKRRVDSTINGIK